MSSALSTQDLKQTHDGIRDKYAKVAVSPEGQFKYPTGRAGLEQLKYDAAIVSELPESVAGSFCGVGNPFSLGEIPPGSRRLDIGCGTGVDALVASKVVGPSGKVMAIDITPEMDFLACLRNTGFVDVASVGETGFNSSPKTRGMLVHARKPGLQDQKSVVSSKTGDIHAPTDAEGASTKMSSKIDTLLQRTITPGAEKTKTDRYRFSN